MPRASSTRYLAFLRGINLGGRTVTMAALREVFSALGFEQVKTLIASGNVSFYAPPTDPKKLATTIAPALEKHFGFRVGTIVRSARSLEELVAARPFGRVRVTPATRLWITLFSDEERSATKGGSKEQTLHKNMRIVTSTQSEVLCVITADQRFGGPEAMKILEQRFGKNITTRTWNTVERLLAL